MTPTKSITATTIANYRRVRLLDGEEKWTVTRIKRNYHTGKLCVHLADDRGGVIVVAPEECRPLT